MPTPHPPDTPPRLPSDSPILAHVRQTKAGTWETQLLEDHLRGVATRAAAFAAVFGNEDWGDALGVLHDLGKFVPHWQRHLRTASGYDDGAHLEASNERGYHSTAGAVSAFERWRNCPPLARALAYPVAGHHAGLPDWDPADDAPGDSLSQRVFLSPSQDLDLRDLDQIRAIDAARIAFEKALPRSGPFRINRLEAPHQEQLHLWIRMLFSCLVDADFLDTEAFMNPEKNALRGESADLAALKERFDAFMASKAAAAPDTPVNRHRKAVLEACRKKGTMPPGIFTLTVPTGGGKTLSSMAFALEHALAHGKKRIIMAIPYTSIIEQTAKVFQYGTDNDAEIPERLRRGDVLFGEEHVVEHHCNLDPEKETPRNRLAAENWDAPIIVTTNVQLFESLFASAPAACRKLHRIAESVIILDEAQMLPPEFLKPILSVLRGLVAHCGVTVVLCTATQPALTGRIGSGEHAFQGLDGCTEIVEAPSDLAESLRRVTLSFPSHEAPPMPWETLAQELQTHDSVLCVVNTKGHCRKLHALMPEGTVHLSAAMCGEERSEIISAIKDRLRRKEPVRVVSTQLVEAGVDIDFPVVYRALGGLDSVAQAAGRCNREGHLDHPGRVVVFRPPDAAPPGLLRKGADACEEMLRTRTITTLDPAHFDAYFRCFFSKVSGFDKPDFSRRMVRESRDFKMQFRTLAQHFRLIDDGAQKNVVVLYEGLRRSSFPLVERLRREGPSRELVRQLQRFSVGVRKPLFEKLRQAHLVEEWDGFFVQSAPGIYRPGLGLLTDEDAWLREFLMA